jgi:DNA mismatch endonuclease, patch repair protein
MCFDFSGDEGATGLKACCMDRIDKATRSRVMAAVRSQNTKPELELRSALHKAGLRYRLHSGGLPGKPDLVFWKYRAVIFVHGCYWHRHGCSRSTVPATRREFWTKKFAANRDRDERQVHALLERRWRVLIVWECALVGRHASPPNEVADEVSLWLRGVAERGEIGGIGWHP